MLLERPSRFYSEEEEEEEEEEREVVERRPRQVLFQVSSAPWFSLFPDSLITVAASSWGGSVRMTVCSNPRSKLLACLFRGWLRADDGMFKSKK